MLKAYKKRKQCRADSAKTGLPEIDFTHGRELLSRGEWCSVPEGWPRNWQWIVAIKDAEEKLHYHEQRKADIRRALSVFREFYDRGDLWPAVKEHKVACLKGGYASVITCDNIRQA